MKHKFKEFLEGLEYSELISLSKQIKEKGSEIRNVLENHLDVTEKINARVCATCGNQLNPGTKTLVLHFGPEDFKKKASFCAFDCLEFFLNHLKQIELKKEKAEKIQ
ncbi:hypothetical protein JXB27_02800 [Candidatus Woesearchaeota archaeon]|nr:hypothetical protein [Candidatus Woesearchaeota archaeon]